MLLKRMRATYDSAGSDGTALSAVMGACILGTSVFLFSLFGIYTRPIGFLATIWPANAVMLGLLLRLRGAATPLGWLAGTAGFLVADLLTGSTFFKTSLLTAGNLAGIGAAYYALCLSPPETAQLKAPTSTLYLVLALAIGAGSAGIVGSIANPILFGGGAISGWTFWFVTEFANYLALLPIILTATPLHFRQDRNSSELIRLFIPVFVLLLSCWVGVIVGGPGAIAFPVPALLWCALFYPMFVTTLLTLIFSVWTLLALYAGYLPNAFDITDENTLISIRMGVCLIALGPIMLASVMAARMELLGRMSHLAAHDQLTGLLNRRAFLENSAHALAALGPHKQPVAVLMIDIDHFKSINDTRGHAAGDMVIATVAERAAKCLRLNDVIGRIGGEEFAALLPGCSDVEALAIAERIRSSIEGVPISFDGDDPLPVTLSVGLAFSHDGSVDLDHLLNHSDLALYEAKSQGRNRTAASQVEKSPPRSPVPESAARRIILLGSADRQ